MENFEKDGNENILENEMNTESGAAEQPCEETDAVSELAQVSDVKLTEVSETSTEEALPTPLYRWNYEEYSAAQAEAKKKKRGGRK